MDLLDPGQRWMPGLMAGRTRLHPGHLGKRHPQDGPLAGEESSEAANGASSPERAQQVRCGGVQCLKTRIWGRLTRGAPGAPAEWPSGACGRGLGALGPCAWQARMGCLRCLLVGDQGAAPHGSARAGRAAAQSHALAGVAAHDVLPGQSPARSPAAWQASGQGWSAPALDPDLQDKGLQALQHTLASLLLSRRCLVPSLCTQSGSHTLPPCAVAAGRS